MAKNMRKIRDLLARDLDCKIEEIIKVDQHDEETVYREITEYVATDRIRNQYREVLNAIADAPADPHEGIGNMGLGILWFRQVLFCQESWVRLSESRSPRPQGSRFVQGTGRRRWHHATH